MHEATLDSAVACYGLDYSYVANSYNNIGTVYREQGQYEEALVQYHKSLEIRIWVLGLDSPDVAACYNNIGIVYEKQGKYEEALVQHQKSLEIKLRVLGEDSPDVATSCNNMGIVCEKQGKSEEALVQYQKPQHQAPGVWSGAPGGSRLQIQYGPNPQNAQRDEPSARALPRVRKDNSQGVWTQPQQDGKCCTAG